MKGPAIAIASTILTACGGASSERHVDRDPSREGPTPVQVAVASFAILPETSEALEEPKAARSLFEDDAYRVAREVQLRPNSKSLCDIEAMLGASRSGVWPGQRTWTGRGCTLVVQLNEQDLVASAYIITPYSRQ